MTFRFAGVFMRFVDYQKEVQFGGETLRQSLQMLVADYPDVKPVLLDNNGSLRGAVGLYLNEEMIHSKDLDAPVGGSDVVEVFTAIAGG